MKRQLRSKQKVQSNQKIQEPVKEDLGKRGEELAAKHLKKSGYRILERNFRSKYGEIDIVALKKNTVVFIEVKTRWSKRFGSPITSITPWKVRKLVKTAHYYKICHPNLPDSLRLDAVLIEMDVEGEIKSIEIVKNITQ